MEFVLTTFVEFSFHHYFDHAKHEFIWHMYEESSFNGMAHLLRLSKFSGDYIPNGDFIFMALCNHRTNMPFPGRFDVFRMYNKYIITLFVCNRHFK